MRTDARPQHRMSILVMQSTPSVMTGLPWVCSVRDISGATVEHNKFCVSVHFRNVEASQYDSVLAAVEATLKQHQELHATRGRKVFEIRPQVSPCSCQYPLSCCWPNMVWREHL